MIDSRSVLPQEFAGGSAGLPCARVRPRASASIARLPPGVKPRQARFGLPTVPQPYQDCRAPDELIAFNGTHTLPWMNARARSMGSLSEADMRTLDGVCESLRACPRGPAADDSRSAACFAAARGTKKVGIDGTVNKGGVLNKVLRCRVETDFHDLVGVLADAMCSERREDLRSFKQPHNPNRHTTGDRYISEEKRRKQVLRTLQKYPLCNIYDLARCDPEVWAEISRELWGVSHGAVMRCMMKHVQQTLPPLDRAAFWAAVGTRQSVCEHGRTTCFAGDWPPQEKLLLPF